MKCPSCPDSTLTMSDRQGVEIDYCPQCRGVWLDRGELDKLIDRAGSQPVPTHPVNVPQPQYRDSGYRENSDNYPRRKKSWMSEIFD